MCNPLASPLPDSQALIINQADQLCGIGEPGEIVIRTPFRTLGYLNGSPEGVRILLPIPFGRTLRTSYIGPAIAAAMTAAACCGFPAGSTIRSKFAATGWNRRKSAQPSRQASRYSAECRDSVTEDNSGEKVLVAYVLQEPKSTLRDLKDFRDFLKQSLPDYMIPAGLYKARQPSIDRQRQARSQGLAGSRYHASAGTAGHVAPRDPTERTLAGFGAICSSSTKLVFEKTFSNWEGIRSLRPGSFRTYVRSSTCRYPLARHIRELDDRAFGDTNCRKAGRLYCLRGRRGHAQRLGIASGTTRRRRTHRAESRQFALTTVMIEKDPALPAMDSLFYCPKTRSRFFGARRCNLLIVINEFFERQSFERLAGYVREFDPEISTLVIRDRASMEVPLPRNPTLIFSPAFLRHQPPVEGRTFCGFPLSKSEEYVALEKAGIPVPKWTLLTEDNSPDLSGFGDYLVKKPDYGARGAEVKIVRKSRVKWKPVTTSVAGMCSSFVLQQFIYTGQRPVSYRVNTLFGKVLYSKRYEVPHDRPAWTGPGGHSNSLAGRSSQAPKAPTSAPSYDEDSFGLASERTARFLTSRCWVSTLSVRCLPGSFMSWKPTRLATFGLSTPVRKQNSASRWSSSSTACARRPTSSLRRPSNSRIQSEYEYGA